MSEKEFRDFARECMRWAEEAETEEHRQRFIEMAKAFLQAASEVSRPPPKTSKEGSS